MHAGKLRAVLLAVLGLCSTVHGATFQWSGGVPITGNFRWSTPANWVGNAVPVSDPNTIIGFGPVGGSLWPISSHDLASPLKLNQLSLGAGAPPMTLMGNTLQFVSSTSNPPARPTLYGTPDEITEHSILNPIVLDAELFVAMYAHCSLVFGGSISGNGRLYLGYTDQFIFGTTATVRFNGANTYTGGTTIGGTLAIFDVLAGHDQAFGTGLVRVKYPSRLRAVDADRTLGNAFHFEDNPSLLHVSAGPDLTFNGAVSVESSTFNVRVENARVTFAGSLNASGLLSKQGPGTLVLAFPDPAGFSSTVRITAGTVRLTRNLPLFFSNVEVQVDHGLDLNGQPTPFLGSLAGTGALHLGNSALTLNGNASTTYSGKLTHDASGSITKRGSGRITLTGTDNRVGRFVIGQGGLEIRGALTTTVAAVDAFKVGETALAASLTIADQGVLDSSASERSLVTGPDGTAVGVFGASARWTAAALTLGGAGGGGVDRGAIAINAGTVQATALRLAESVGGLGSVNVFSNGTLITTSAAVGVQGEGQVFLGNASAWTGTTLQLGGDGAAGISAKGSLRLDGASQATLTGRVTLWNEASSIGVAQSSLSIGSLSSPPGSIPSVTIADMNSISPALIVGTDHTDSTFHGRLGPAVGAITSTLRKVGNGTLTLAGPVECSALRVEGGRVQLQQSWPSAQVITVAAGATLELLGSGLVIGNGAVKIAVEAGGTLLVPAGTVLAGSVKNYGLIANSPAGPSGQLRITGPLENYGILRQSRGAVLVSESAFFNQGRLDLITGGLTSSGAFTNTGTVLLSDSLRYGAVERVGTSFVVTLPAYAGHVYQLQRSDGLNPSAFTHLGPAQQTGATQDQVLIFTDPNASGSEAFYRLVVDP